MCRAVSYPADIHGSFRIVLVSLLLPSKFPIHNVVASKSVHIHAHTYSLTHLILNLNGGERGRCRNSVR